MDNKLSDPNQIMNQLRQALDNIKPLMEDIADIARQLKEEHPSYYSPELKEINRDLMLDPTFGKFNSLGYNLMSLVNSNGPKQTRVSYSTHELCGHETKYNPIKFERKEGEPEYIEIRSPGRDYCDNCWATGINDGTIIPPSSAELLAVGLYSEYSEDRWCASWMGEFPDFANDFKEWLVNGVAVLFSGSSDTMPKQLQYYEKQYLDQIVACVNEVRLEE